MKTKIQTKTIAAIALVTLAAGSVIFGLTFISKRIGQKLSGNPYAKTISQTGTTKPAYVGPPVSVNDTTTAPTTNTTIPVIQPVPVSGDAEISCDAKSIAIKSTGYGRRKNGVYEYKVAIDASSPSCPGGCSNNPGWTTPKSILGSFMRCSMSCESKGSILTASVTVLAGGIKVEGRNWSVPYSNPLGRPTCIAHWSDMNCPQVTTYAQTYSGQPCIKAASPCDVPVNMTVVDFSACPVPAAH